MKNFTRRGMALLLSVLLLCSLSVGALAANEVKVTAKLDNATLTKSDAAQTVTLTVAPESPVTACSVGLQVTVPADWTIKDITNTDSSMTLTENNVTLSTGKIGWMSAGLVDCTISTFGIYTIEIPAGAETGSYELKVTGVDVTKNFAMDDVMTATNTATATLTIEDGSVNPPEPVIPEGYSVAASGDASINVGETANVALNVTHKDGKAYNAYYFEVSYNKDVLTYAGETADGIKVDAENGKLTIAGYGAEKASGTPAVTLTFTGVSAGAGEVTVFTANVDESANANVQDAPEATITTATATITVGGYSVTLPEGFTGAASAEAGKDYTFTGGDDHGCYDVTATMGGADTTVENDGNGGYTIKNVTGEIVVKATPKSYAVTVTGGAADDVTLPEAKPTYKTPYTFTVKKDAGYTYEVKASVNGADVTVTETTDGYTIDGTAIKGDITINVEETPISTGTTTITITAPAGVLKGSDSQTATNGKDYTIEINREDGYNYTAKLGDGTELDADTDGNFVIRADKINGTALTVTVTKTAVNPYSVEVYEYVKLDKTVMWLVTAKSEAGKALAYGTEGTMFYSEKYAANCWLVISAESEDTVKAAAIAAIAESTETAANVDYSGNANQTGTTDVNDAQFVYNVYNAVYESFEAASRAQLLAADVNGDKTVNVSDAAAIVSIILK